MISSLTTALGVAFYVVVVETTAISRVRWKYMDTSLLRAGIQVALVGALVFATGILISNE